MDPLARVDAVIAVVEAARSVPMSANCLVNRGELLSALSQLRSTLPGEFAEAKELLAQRDAVVAAGREEAQRIVAEGHVERNRLVSTHEVALAAQAEAARIVGEARGEAQRLREEVENYVDTSLANFEQLLERTLHTVRRGHDRMHAMTGLEGGFEPEADEKPLPF